MKHYKKGFVVAGCIGAGSPPLPQSAPPACPALPPCSIFIWLRVGDGRCWAANGLAAPFVAGPADDKNGFGAGAAVPANSEVLIQQARHRQRTFTGWRHPWNRRLGRPHQIIQIDKRAVFPQKCLRRFHVPTAVRELRGSIHRGIIGTGIVAHIRLREATGATVDIPRIHTFN